MSEKHAHHAHPGLTSIIVKVVIFTAVSVLITSIVVTSLLDLDVNPTNGYAADFTNVSGLQPGDSVRIAGVEVGKVGAVSLQGNHARVSFSLDTSQHLTTTSTATIHFENLLGQRFLAILPGAAGGQPLRPGGTIPSSRTTPALDLTAVFDGFEPLFSALAPDQVNQLSQSIIVVFQGESGTVSSSAAETAAITTNLADRQAVINGLLTSLASLLNAVGAHDTQLGQLISNFDTLVQGLATSRSQLGSAITNLSTLTTTVSGLLGQSQPQLDQDIDGLATASQSLAANQAGINSLLEGFPGLLNALTKIQSTGNWINAYICDLTVNVEGGPLNISLIPGVKAPVYPDPVSLPSGAVGNQAAPHRELLMKRFRERNRPTMGVVTLVVIVVLIAGSLEFSKLPLIHSTKTYSADFADAGGLASTDIVTVDGVKVGTITGLKLQGDKVKVSFALNGDLQLGSTTSAAAKVLSPIGTEYLELTPSGPGKLSEAIPVSRTTVPYTLVSSLSQLGSQIQQYNIPALEKALQTGSADLEGTSASETTAAFDGLARVSQILGNQQTALATIVSQGAGLTAVLSQRSGQLFDLVGQADLVLPVLEQRQAAIKALLDATSSLSQELTSILSTNSSQLTTLLTNLQSVSAVLASDSNDLGEAIPVLAAFSKYAANSTGSGAFADVSVPTLLIPDNLVKQCSAPGAFPSTNPQVGCRPVPTSPASP